VDSAGRVLSTPDPLSLFARALLGGKVGALKGLSASGSSPGPHDLHPDHATTRYARRRADGEGTGLVAVQHHHAHLASCMAENGLAGTVIGVALDGTGFGAGGGASSSWAVTGEFRRGAHPRYVGMPGDVRAIREPWRMAVTHLLDAGVSIPPPLVHKHHRDIKMIWNILGTRLNTP
jgi:hydrogenase maturation protein HypF